MIRARFIQIFNIEEKTYVEVECVMTHSTEIYLSNYLPVGAKIMIIDVMFVATGNSC